MTALRLSTVDLLWENKNSGKDNKKRMSQENLIFKIKTAILAIAWSEVNTSKQSMMNPSLPEDCTKNNRKSIWI